MSKVTPHIVTITCLFPTACRLAVAIGIFLTKSQKCHEPWRIFFDEILEALDLKCGGGIEWWVGEEKVHMIIVHFQKFIITVIIIMIL